MSRPIRAFLILRTDGDWEVRVCRDLEAVLDAWSARPDSGQTAVLHIGFDRPPSAAFDDLALQYPGRLLATASAKFGLPRGYETSEHPVAVIDDLPIFIGTRGWGYLVEDHELPAQPRSAPLPEYSPRGWVRDFLAARRDLEDALGEAGIFDDDSYLELEGRLAWEARLRAGQFRFRSLVDSAEEDPCAMARGAPPWLGRRPFSEMKLPVRPANAFVNCGIRLVSDLASVQALDLLKIPNFGRKSLREVAQVILDALEEGPMDAEARLQQAGAESLRVEIQRSLSTMEERERDILSRRMGFGGDAETLQTIADTYGITRERIRQIETKVVTRTIREAFWDDLLTGKLEALLAGREFPLPLLGIEAIDPWFAGMAEHSEAIRYILANFCGDHIGLVEIDGVDYFAFLHQSEWEAAVLESHRVLGFCAGKQWTEDHCKSLVHALIKDVAKEFRGLLWQKAIPLCHFDDGPPGERVLVSYGRGAEQLVTAILAASPRPLHYSEITAEAERLGRPIDLRRAHAAAGVVGILLGRGTFGLEQHLGLAKGEAERITDEAEAVVLAGPANRQWHTSEICAALVERDIDMDQVDKYVVDYLLRKSGLLRGLGRLTWSPAAIGDSGDRLEVKEAVVELLLEAGRPLSTEEIRQRLVARRGVNTTFQIHPRDPILRLGYGIWGLNDRDVPVKRNAQPELLAHLHDYLGHLGKGVHITEAASGALSGGVAISPDSLFALALLDHRMAVSPGQYLYLKAWGGPRR
ncbi:MAG: DNA-directed RNA polymerase subunit alpha C-terminal domain-containing protein, partial [Isosphaeraceae bacterium]